MPIDPKHNDIDEAEITESKQSSKPQAQALGEPSPGQLAAKDANELAKKKPATAPPDWSLGRLFFVILALLAIAGTLFLQWRHTPVANPKPPTELIVVQLNDIYRLDAVRNGTRGGLARVASLIRQLKAENPNVPVIVLHAGDFLGPSLESEVFHGAQMIDALNFLHEIAPVYAVPGNHEFDFNDKQKDFLSQAIERSKFRWVASNLERGDGAMLPALRNNVAERVVETFGKVKVGIFALTLDSSHKNKDQPYAPISGDYAGVARREIEQLERAGAELIVGLTHLDIDDDRELAKLRREHPRFRWIAGGHEHSLEREPAWSGGALITKGDSNARTVWKVSVVRQRGETEVREQSVALDEEFKGDPDFEREIQNLYHSKLRNTRSYLDEVIAKRTGCYDGSEETVRNKESDWGSYLADNMRKAYKKPADVGVINGGSIRVDDTFCDKVNFEHLERTFAYPTPIVFVKLTGKDLKEQILDHAVNTKRGDGRFLQVSGVSFRLEASPSAQRYIKDLKIQSGKNWVNLQEDKQYVVAVSQYLFECGDDYPFRKYVTEYIPPGPDLRTVTYGALKALGKTNAPTAIKRIIDLPPYAKPFVATSGAWTGLSDLQRQCK